MKFLSFFTPYDISRVPIHTDHDTHLARENNAFPVVKFQLSNAGVSSHTANVALYRDLLEKDVVLQLCDCIRVVLTRFVLSWGTRLMIPL